MSLSQLKQRTGAFRFYLFILLAMLGSGYIGFSLSKSVMDWQTDKVGQLSQSSQNLRLENNRLTEELNRVEVALEVEKLASQKANDETRKLWQQIRELKTQVAFYQKVMAPELTAQGFVIEAFHVNPAASENFYRFELVLTQQDKIKNMITGNIDIKLQGSRNGKPAKLDLEKLLSEQEPTKLVFGFKYFQVLEGQFRLPADFIPEKVDVSADIYQFKRKKGELSRSFNWQLQQDLPESFEGE